MNELLTFGILAFTSFFTLINPLGVMPIFMTMSADLTAKNRAKTAKKASKKSTVFAGPDYRGPYYWCRRISALDRSL